MVYTLRFFYSSKRSLFHNSNVFGSGIIHILYTGCAKIKKKQLRRQKVNQSDNTVVTADMFLLASDCIVTFLRERLPFRGMPYV